MKHINLKIFGKVQMVGFRFNAKHKADNFGVRGFVRNEPDGSVYCEVEGKEEAVEEFVKWCKKGPRFAKVKRVEAEEGEPKGFSDFDIEY